MKRLIYLIVILLIDLPIFSQINVTSNGYVGVGGITTPKGQLHWAGDLYGKGHIYLHAYEGDGSSGTAYIQARDKSSSSSIALQLRSKNGASVINSLRIDPDGRVYVPKNAYFACQPASSGFYFENSSTNPIILPQWGNSMYIGRSDRELWDVTSHYFHYDYLYQQSSDISVKENIREIDGALAKILNIRGVTYDYKTDYYLSNAQADKLETLSEERKDNIGFIAQELQEVIPKLVVLNKESNIYNVNYIGLVPVLVEAIKEQQDLIDELKSDIEKLKTSPTNKSE
ncbi:tail fiber domain-containing protein, partial [Bacteroidota bacterium]